MNKEGHIGVVQSTLKPIAKGGIGGSGVNQPILKRSETLDHSYSQNQLVSMQSNDVGSQNMSNASYFRKIDQQAQHNGRYDQAQSGNLTKRMQRNLEMSPNKVGGNQVLNTIDNTYEKVSSPLMRVGSTITTQISSPGQGDLQSMMSSSSRRGDFFRNSHQIGQGNRMNGFADQIYMNQGNDLNNFSMNQGGGFTPMAYQNYNNVAASSFYSHQPFGQTSGYMGTFGAGGGGPLGIIRQPMDQFGYGSYTMNFNRNMNPMQPTFYSDQQPFMQQQQQQIMPQVSFRASQQQPQANYMPQINVGVSKYQEFANQVSKSKVDSINQVNGVSNLPSNRSPINRLNRNQAIENSPPHPYNNNIPQDAYQNSQVSMNSQIGSIRGSNTKNRGQLRVARSIEVSSMKRATNV
eukprot:403362291